MYTHKKYTKMESYNLNSWYETQSSNYNPIDSHSGYNSVKNHFNDMVDGYIKEKISYTNI